MDREADRVETVIVDTPSGRLAGIRKADIVSFKGIPFARPPLGPLRWRMPEPSQPWAGVRDAIKFAPTCPQAPTQLESLMGMTVGEQSEDCLYLNIWTQGADDGKRPVMVWLHGGAFVLGAGSHAVYDGRRLASRGVVVVTINYRLGAFGFLGLALAGDSQAPGSGAEGIADQVLALHWVKRHIASFGGDPENVTIFGESAGGMSVGILLASPPARGLFHKAIVQSGGAHIGHSPDRSARVAHAFLAELGLDAAQACDAPYSAIIGAQIALLTKRGGKLGLLPFQPTIDGHIIPDRPIGLLRMGESPAVPLLVGTTREEWKLFTAAAPRLRFMSAKSLAGRVERMLGDAAPTMLEIYDEGSPFERFNALMTDKAFFVPATRLLDARQARAPVFAYRFDWRSNLLGGLMGSCHALELGFVFGTHKQRLSGTFFGTGATAEKLAGDMMDAWTNFAKTGDPSTGVEAWPRYDPAARTTLVFGDGAPRIAHQLNEHRLRAWDAVPERKLGF